MKRTLFKRLKKSVSAILAAAMSLSLFTAIPVSADIGRTTYNYDGYSVNYNVTNEWDGAQTVELTVSNTGTDSILNWALKYDAEGEISNLWNADLYEQNGDEYVIKNVGWNFEIAPSQSVTYGYTLSGNDLTLPENFEIYSKRVDKTEGYDVQYNITKSWDTGVEGNIVITNTSVAPIEAWTLSLDSNFTIDNLWNGRVLENNGTSYTVAAEMWTNPIQPNSSMTIGFIGTKAVDVEAILYNFTLSEVQIESLEKNNHDIVEGDILTELITSYNKLNLIYALGDSSMYVTQNIGLINNLGMTTILWESSNEDIISSEGIVRRPHGDNKPVKLIATISYNEYVLTKEFTVTVISESNIDNYINENIDSIIECTDVEMLYYYNDDIEKLQVFLNDIGYVNRIEGSFSDNIVNSPNSALLSLYYIKSLIGSESPKDEFAFSMKINGATGEYYIFNQMYQGIPVYNMSVRIGTDSDMHTDYLNSCFAYGIDISTNPSIGIEQISNIVSQNNYLLTDEPQLVVFTFNQLDGTKAKLAWNCNVSSDSFMGNVIFDAHSGDKLFENSIAASEIGTYLGTGTDVTGNAVSFNTAGLYFPQASPYPVIYYMQDLDRNILMYETTSKQFDYKTDCYGTIIVNNSTDWSKHDPEVISTYMNVCGVFDFYKNNLNYDINRDNKALTVSFDKNFFNNSECYGSLKVLRFGDPSSPLQDKGYVNNGGTAIDTVGHELTHLVVYQTNPSLFNNYKNASGAINEGYADIFGYLIKNDNKDEWLYRDTNTYGHRASRNLTNPSEFNQPSKIGGANYQDYTINPDDNGGVHTNNTIVSHAAYLMWKNVISDRELLSKIWFESLRMGYTNNANFAEVRKNVITASKKYNLSNADINKINAVFDEMCYPQLTPITTVGTSKIVGKVVETNTTLNTASMPPISDVTVSLFRKSAKGENLLISSTITDSSGEFNFDSLLPGNYEIYIYKSEFLQTIQYVTINSTNYTHYATTVELISSKIYNGQGNASGIISDAISAVGVNGLTLHIRKGIDNFYSTSPILTIVTGSNGEYQISNITAGNYTVEVIDNRMLGNENDRYVTTHFNVKVLGGTTVSGQNASISNSLNPGQMRIVLTWGANPRDLDSHLTGPTGNGGNFHIYYGIKTYFDGENIVANLDLDDTTSYGPETTTIYNPANGTYTFYVYNYSGSPAITTSGATVEVYLGNNNVPSRIFNIPAQGSGRYWTVFKYAYSPTTRTIIPVNVISSSIVA